MPAALQNPALGPVPTMAGAPAPGAAAAPEAAPVSPSPEGAEQQEPYQPKLSKHEKDLMQKAHERHVASITSKQVSMPKPCDHLQPT